MQIPSCLHSPRITLTQWLRNHKETASRNYARLGLTSRLNQISGGIEKDASIQSSDFSHSKFSIRSQLPTSLQASEAHVERDPETGQILRILDQGRSRKSNPLNDPISELVDTDSENESSTEPYATGGKTLLVQQLEHRASREEPKAKRKQSSREIAWVETLVRRYGDNYSKMVWDKELNPRQQSMGDIKRRIQCWKDSQV